MMKNERTDIFVKLLFLVIILSFLIGCVEENDLDSIQVTKTISTETEKGVFISANYIASGETQFSDMFFNSENELCVYFENNYTTKLYNISKNEIFNPEVSEKINTLIKDLNFKKVLWRESILNMDSMGNMYLCYQIGESYSEGFYVICSDQNGNALFNICISSLLKDQLNLDFTSIKIIPMEDGKICVLVGGVYSNWVVIVDALNEEVLNSFSYSFFPKKVTGNTLIGISQKGDKVISVDISNGNIIKEIETGLNLTSVNSWDESLDIYCTDQEILMVNKSGIYKAQYSDDSFECVLNQMDTNFLSNTSAFKNILSDVVSEEKLNEFISSKELGYRIVSNSENVAYVEVSIPDSAGYASIKCYVRYEF